MTCKSRLFVVLTPVCSSTCRQDSWIFFSCSGDKILKVELLENERIASDIGGNLLRAALAASVPPVSARLVARA